MKIRAEEEAERKRNQRIVGDIEEDEDFDAFEMRQKAEAMEDQEQMARNEAINEEGEEEEYDDELERQEGEEDDEDFDGNRSTGESNGATLSGTKLT